jgi:hypothetical protein
VRQKKKPTTARVKKLLLFIGAPIVIWVAAFVVWLHWSDIAALLNRAPRLPTAAGTRPVQEPYRAEGRRDKLPPEKISEQERKKLEEILKGK